MFEQVTARNIKSIDKQLETTIKSISINEVNHMLGKTIDVKYHEISNLLEEELIQLEDKKKSCLQEIDDLDNQKDWTDWISKYGKDMDKRFKKPTSKLIEGIVDEITVSPVMGTTREGKSYQRGHKFKVKFKLPIVNDSLKYQNLEIKSDGYTISKGDKSIETQVLEVKQQGRPKKESIQKKVHTNLLNSNRNDSCVPLLTDTVPFLEFSIEFQSNNLTYQQKYTKKLQRIHDLIVRLNRRGLGYRKISQKLNRWGIKTKRSNMWSNSSVYSVIKRKQEREVLSKNTRNIDSLATVSEFKVKYYTYD